MRRSASRLLQLAKLQAPATRRSRLPAAMSSRGCCAASALSRSCARCRWVGVGGRPGSGWGRGLERCRIPAVLPPCQAHSLASPAIHHPTHRRSWTRRTTSARHTRACGLTPGSRVRCQGGALACAAGTPQANRSTPALLRGRKASRGSPPLSVSPSLATPPCPRHRRRADAVDTAEPLLPRAWGPVARCGGGGSGVGAVTPASARRALCMPRPRAPASARHIAFQGDLFELKMKPACCTAAQSLPAAAVGLCSQPAITCIHPPCSSCHMLPASLCTSSFTGHVQRA